MTEFPIGMAIPLVRYESVVYHWKAFWPWPASKAAMGGPSFMATSEIGWPISESIFWSSAALRSAAVTQPASTAAIPHAIAILKNFIYAPPA